MTTRIWKTWIIWAMLLLLLCGTMACTPKETAPAQTEEPAAAIEAEPAAVPADQPEAPAAHPAPYKLGDKAEDFTVTMSDGTQTSLYGLLKTKKAVLLNFFTSWCGPCKMEFPFMEEAYNEVSDDIGIIALSVEENDTDEIILAFQKELGLSKISLGLDTVGLRERFKVDVFPISVMVDRNGVICMRHEGSIPDKDMFLRLFSVFTAADYDKPVLLNGIPSPKSKVAHPSAEELRKALQIKDGAIAVQIPEDDTVWPFVPGDKDGVVEAANTAVSRSSAKLTVSVAAKAGEGLAYECIAAFPAGYNDLDVYVDDLLMKAYGGAADWTKDYVKFDEAGTHTVTFAFERGLTQSGKASAMLRGLSLLTANAVKKMEAAKPVLPATLSGTECKITLASGAVKPVKFTEVQNGKASEIFCDLAQGEKLVYRIEIGDQINPDAAFVGEDYNFIRLADLRSDSEGYYYEVTDFPTDWNDFHALSVIAADINGNNDGTERAMVEWINSEPEIDNMVASIKSAMPSTAANAYELTWEYADGSPKQSESAKGADDAGQGAYVITVTDEQGKPVEGVMLQICDESTCQMSKTGKDGKVIHAGAPYAYEIHVLKAPEGYAKHTEIYTMPLEGGELTIKLKKQ